MTCSARQIPDDVIFSDIGSVILREGREANKPKDLRLLFGISRSPRTGYPILAALSAAGVEDQPDPASPRFFPLSSGIAWGIHWRRSRSRLQIRTSTETRFTLVRQRACVKASHVMVGV
jgi:hypothetical protein